MAGIKFFISSTAAIVKDKNQKQVLMKANTSMAEMITEVRNICFNLMPRTLEEFGLIKAVKVLCDHVVVCKGVQFDIRQEFGWPLLFPALSIDLYRVVQEFVYNSVIHGEARSINILFTGSKNMLLLKMWDNGCGFDTLKSTTGMGLKNVASRVRSHEGKFELTSSVGKGTQYKINIPLN